MNILIFRYTDSQGAFCMSPLLQCSIVLVGMAVGYKAGGVFGTLLAVVSGGAGLRQYMQVNIFHILTFIFIIIFYF